MKRVLFLVNHDMTIYNMRLELVERLLSDGHEVWISCPEGERTVQLQEMGCHFVKTEISRHGMNPVTEAVLLRTYKRIIRQVKPDAVFSYTIKPNIYGAMACKKLGVPCVMNITGLGTAVENGGLLQKVMVMLYRMAVPGARTIFFQNEENRSFFLQHNLAPEKHAMLPGSGVNLQRFSLLDYPGEETIAFSFIARIMKEKGIDQYLEAARVIRQKYPNTRFHVCGFCEAEYDGKLHDYAADGTVIYHGMVSDIRSIHQKVHCIVHPTYYPEGLSNVLLEACASGRPIITTDRSGCREVIDDGVNGFVVKQKDTQDLIAKLEQFIAMPHPQKREMGLAGRRKVEQSFDRQIVVRAYLNELEKLDQN